VVASTATLSEQLRARRESETPEWLSDLIAGCEGQTWPESILLEVDPVASANPDHYDRLRGLSDGGLFSQIPCAQAGVETLPARRWVLTIIALQAVSQQAVQPACP